MGTGRRARADRRARDRRRGSVLPGEDGAEPAPAGSLEEIPSFGILVLLLVALVPVAPFPFLPVITGRPFATLDVVGAPQQLAFGFLTLLAGLALLARPAPIRRTPLLTRVTAPILGLAAFAGVAAAWAPDLRSAGETLATLAVTVTLLELGRRFVRLPGALDRAAALLLAGAGLQLVFAAGQIAGIESFTLGPPDSTVGAEEPVGLMGNRNHLAFFLTLVLPVILEARRRAPPRWRWLATVQLAATGVVLAFTLCRGALLAAAWVLLTARRRTDGHRDGAGSGGGEQPAPGPAGPGGTAGAATAGGERGLAGHGFTGSSPAGPDPVGRGLAGRGPAGRGLRAPLIAAATFGGLAVLIAAGPAALVPAKWDTAHSRLLAWQLTLGEIAAAPVLGHGPGSFAHRFQEAQEARFRGFLEAGHPLSPQGPSPDWKLARFFRHAHNDLLQLVLELGLAGALGLLILGRELRRAARSGDHRTVVARRVLIASFLLALTGFPFQIPATLMVVTLALAVVDRGSVALERPSWGAGPRSRTPALAALGWRGARLAAAVGALVLLGRTIRTWNAEVAHTRALLEVAAPGGGGDAGRARSWLEEALRSTPDHPRLLTELGRLRFHTGDLDGAEACFRRSLEVYRASSGRVNLGCVLAERGDLAGALAEFTRAAEMNPASPENLYRVGFTRARVGDPVGALGALDLALSLNAQDPRIGWEKARILMETGHDAQAFHELQLNLALLNNLLAHPTPAARIQAGAGPETLRGWAARNLQALMALGPRLGRDGVVDGWIVAARAWGLRVEDPPGPGVPDAPVGT